MPEFPDVPERIITDEDTKLWRTPAIVLILTEDDALTDYRFQNPRPVYAGERLVGAATLEIRGRFIYADLFLDYAIPERLDVEAGKKLWACPKVMSTNFVRAKDETTGKTVNVPTISTIDEIELRSDVDDPDYPPLGSAIL